MRSTIEQYENLANAIILQAIDDWKLCTDNRNGHYVHPKHSWINRDEIKSFFRSKWFATLSDADPEGLIAALEESEKSS